MFICLFFKCNLENKEWRGRGGGISEIEGISRLSSKTDSALTER